MKRYKVITLCGSTRFKKEFEEVNRKLTLEGNIVISIGCYGHAGDEFTDEEKKMLDDIHKAKIDLADEIFVINKDKYIGSSTRSEIEYAEKNGKIVNYLEDVEGEKDMNVVISALKQVKNYERRIAMIKSDLIDNQLSKLVEKWHKNMTGDDTFAGIKKVNLETNLIAGELEGTVIYYCSKYGVTEERFVTFDELKQMTEYKRKE